MDTKRLTALAIAGVAAITASGCWEQNTKKTPPPTMTVTLESLICSVQEAIISTARPGTNETGLAPTEATVTAALTFVEASETSASLKLGVVEFGPSFSKTRSNEAANSVSITFKPGESKLRVAAVDGQQARLKLAPGDELELNGCSKPAMLK